MKKGIKICFIGLYQVTTSKLILYVSDKFDSLKLIRLRRVYLTRVLNLTYTS